VSPSPEHRYLARTGNYRLGGENAKYDPAMEGHRRSEVVDGYAAPDDDKENFFKRFKD